MILFLNSDRATRIAFLSFLITSPAYYFCRSKHFCMAGHLQHLDDFTPLAYLTDGLWVIGFLVSIILAFWTDITFRYIFAFVLGVGFLFFADPNGLGAFLQLPVQITLCLFAIAGLFGWIP